MCATAEELASADIYWKIPSEFTVVKIKSWTSGGEVFQLKTLGLTGLSNLSFFIVVIALLL